MREQWLASPQDTAMPDRRFGLEKMYPQRFKPEDIESPGDGYVYLACPGSRRKCLRHGIHVGHHDCFIIAIDGACSNNGNPNARGSIGVYCGDGNIHNVSKRLLVDDERHTNQIAGLEACSEGLIAGMGILNELIADGGKPSILVIKSDSAYVVRGLTEWLPKWQRNGWKNSRGLPVANAILFQRLGYYIEVLETVATVKFWLVPRALNQNADKLANDALN
ncbi:ribonuclease H-like domain-containing protein [Aspergillus carlsbadensis]|nr:ribonuclease H-like domain-containing protein [Aspergillus carlsbadensis]